MDLQSKEEKCQGHQRRYSTCLQRGSSRALLTFQTHSFASWMMLYPKAVNSKHTWGDKSKVSYDLSNKKEEKCKHFVLTLSSVFSKLLLNCNMLSHHLLNWYMMRPSFGDTKIIREENIHLFTRQKDTDFDFVRHLWKLGLFKVNKLRLFKEENDFEGSDRFFSYITFP